MNNYYGENKMTRLSMDTQYIVTAEDLMRLVEIARRPSQDVTARVDSAHPHSRPRTFRRAVVNQYISLSGLPTVK